MILSELLFLDYNTYRTRTHRVSELVAQHGDFMRKWLKATPARMQLFGELAEWCRGKGVEPRLWLFHLFRMRKWRWYPKLQPSDLMSEKALASFAGQERLGFFVAHTRQHALVRDDAYDPNRDLTSSVEALKGQYARTGEHARCMDEQLVATLGYHPASLVCLACPVREVCALRLESAVSFSLLAVRAGRLTAAQAEHISRRGGTW